MNRNQVIRVIALTAFASLGLHAGLARAQTTASEAAPPPAEARGKGYTCVAMIVTKSSAGTSGKAQLGQAPVTSPSQCHAHARKAFKANASWFDPVQVCARYPNQTVDVMAVDYYQEMPGPNANRVDGYQVVCSSVANWDHNLQLVAHQH